MTNDYPASDSDLVVIYGGSDLDTHVMDARDLGPALTAMGGMFERANFLLNGGGVAIDVKVQASRPGSYEVPLMLYQTLTGLLGGEFVTSAITLRHIVIGLVSMIKRLKGEHKIIPAKPGDIQLEIDRLVTGEIQIEGIRLSEPADEANVSEQLLRLFRDLHFREAVAAVVAPVGKEGYNRLVIRNGDREVEIGKEDVSSFAVIQEESVLSISDSRERLTVISPYLGERSGKWRLAGGNGTNDYEIQDSEFEKAVREGVHKFAAGDTLTCEVRTSEIMTRRGTKRTDFAIMKVWMHNKDDMQLRLWE